MWTAGVLGGWSHTSLLVPRSQLRHTGGGTLSQDWPLGSGLQNVSNASCNQVGVGSRLVFLCCLSGVLHVRRGCRYVGEITAWKVRCFETFSYMYVRDSLKDDEVVEIGSEQDLYCQKMIVLAGQQSGKRGTEEIVAGDSPGLLERVLDDDWQLQSSTTKPACRHDCRCAGGTR